MCTFLKLYEHAEETKWDNLETACYLFLTTIEKCKFRITASAWSLTHGQRSCWHEEFSNNFAGWTGLQI